MATIDIHSFLRDCYLHAEPSIDIDKAERVECNAHKLKMSVYDKLLQDYGVTDADGNATDENILLGVAMYCMNKGPVWVDDIKAA
jgi:hypothetical protein